MERSGNKLRWKQDVGAEALRLGSSILLAAFVASHAVGQVPGPPIFPGGSGGNGSMAAPGVSMSVPPERAPAPAPLRAVPRASAQPPRAGEAGPGKVLIADVVVQGNRHVSTQNIMSQLKTKPGGEFTSHLVQEDVRKLMSTKQFASVDPRLENLPDGRVTVYFLIKDFPSVIQNVTYQGAKHLREDELSQITMISKGRPLSPMANKLACQAIVRRYQELGRPFASCELIKGGEAGDTEVIFSVTEGPVVKVRGIEFEGQTFVSSGVLATHVQSSKKFLGLLGGKFNAMLADNDILKLEEYYKSHGFLDVRVGRELRWTPDGREVDLVFHVREGLRYTVEKPPQVVNARSVPAEQLEQLSKVKAGQYFSESRINNDKRAIEDYIGYMGREARVTPTPVYVPETPGLVRLQYEVTERQPARVGQILIVGNERTKQNVILRQVPLYSGQVLTYPDLRVAERNLAKLNIFETSPDGNVRPTVTVLDPEGDSEFKDLLVQIQETTTGSLLFGVGVNSDAGLNGSIVLNERNFDIARLPTSLDDLISGGAFRGAGQEFRVEAVPGNQLQRYSVSFREPFLFDSPWSFGVSGYYFSRNYLEYTEERLGARFTLGRRLNQYWSLNGSVRVENIGVFDVPDGAPTDYTSVEGYNFLTAAKIGVTRDSRDSFLRATEGSLIDASFEQAFGEFTFPLVNLEFNKYFTTYQRADGSGRHVLAYRSQFSWAGENTPVYERFFAGGFRSIRGFSFRGVGPNENGFMTGGDFMFLNSLEYQIPVMANDQVYLVGFLDSGTVEPDISKIENYRVSAGFGARFVVPMMGPVPIALDFGFPIAKAPTDRNQMFQFWLGFFR
ncbi:MAG: outer membrane protein assembly factor BamA [Gemmataceae bacterium]|jgi:outer membrane protein assembly complex protein YaeT|nr:outer membrane protein assembly factor BamA [Planctomycetota bacterium]